MARALSPACPGPAVRPDRDTGHAGAGIGPPADGDIGLAAS
jgi:hypothetical protein